MMVKTLTTMLILLSLKTIPALSQNLQSMISGELSTGYSSNTFLNPYYSEWDRSSKLGYGLASSFGSLFWNKHKNNIEITGGLVFEPIYSSQPAWKGYITSASYNREVNRKFHVGVTAGTSSFQSSFTRDLKWVQPNLIWFPSLYTSLSLKTNIFKTQYQNFQDSLNFSHTMNSYSLEFETWPTFRWQLKAGLYGSLDDLPAVSNEFTAGLSVAHSYLNNTRLNVGFKFSNFRSEILTEGNQPGPPNRPVNESSETEWIDNRLYRLKFEGSYPLNRNWSVFLSSEYSYYESADPKNFSDVQFSGGVRYFIRPQFNFSKNEIEPKWSHSSNKSSVNVKYIGDGFLYLTGNFNNWNNPGIPLVKKSKNLYSLTLDLKPGVYEYKILLIEAGNEEWLKFSKNTNTVKDNFGDVNGILTIE